MPTDRNQTTARISRAELATLNEIAKAVPGVVDDHLEAIAEWEGEVVGTPPETALPGVSRASTRHDPLTTAVLAEIAREPADKPKR